jgi:hypothetical protein
MGLRLASSMIFIDKCTPRSFPFLLLAAEVRSAEQHEIAAAHLALNLCKLTMMC